MFLYVVPHQAQPAASTAPRFTASLNDNRDDWCFGFDSEQLAAALNITTDSLFQANRHRELTLENVEASTPDGEMALKTIYLPRRWQRNVIERPDSRACRFGIVTLFATRRPARPRGASNLAGA